MKIVLISTDTKGGAGKACIRLACSLNNTAERHEVKVLVAKKQGNILFVQQIKQGKTFIITSFFERLFFVFHEVSKKVRWHFSPAKYGIDISMHPSVLEADVIHLHWINNGFLSLKNIAQLQALGKPIVWTLHDMWVFTGGCHYAGDCKNYETSCGNCKYLRKAGNHDLSTSVFQEKKTLLTKNHWQFVACSNWLSALAKSSLLLSRYPIAVIPNPIDTNLFQPQDIFKRRIELDLPKNKKLLLFIATSIKDERKGFVYLLSMLQELYKSKRYTEDELGLVMVGNANKIIFDNLKYPVHYLGHVDSEEQLVKIYGACDVLIIPSIEDNLPNIVMESLACGTPVLAFSTGGIPEMVSHLQQGYIAKYKNVDDLVFGLEWILNMHPEDYKALRINCIEKVQSLYTYQKIADQYSEIYNKIQSQKTP